MFAYRAYGLGIHCDFELPEFVAGAGDCDVAIRLDPAPAPPEALIDESSVDFTERETTLSFKRAGVFRVRDGREVVINAAPGADQSLLRLYLVGKVLATLLYQRGLLVLHGSAVEVDGQAVCFMGVSCFGKSSIAATLHRAGHKIVADDITAVDLRGSLPLALPAFPQLKLDPEVANALGYTAESLVPLHSLETRLGLRVADSFTTTAVPLGLVYLLGSDSVARQPLTAQTVLVELIRNSFPTRLHQSGGAPHLLQCSQLAKQVATARLGRQESRMTPAELSRRVRQDLAASSRIAVSNAAMPTNAD
jgi:hypothetical protein